MMNEMIDLCPYLPEQANRIRPTSNASAPRVAPTSFMLALEAVVTAIIGVSIMIGVAAFALML